LVRVDQQTVEAVRSARLRLREITLPVEYARPPYSPAGTLVRKKCPMVKGKPVTLIARVPYAEHRARASQRPTRALAVLTLIDLCLVPRKTVEVTPTSVEREGNIWRVRFVKGDHAIGAPLFLSRTRGYTTVTDELGAGEVVLPTIEDMRKAREKAQLKRDLPKSNGAAALKLAHRNLALRKHTMTIAQRRQLDRAGKAIDRLVGELALDSGAIFDTSDRAQLPSAPPSRTAEATSRGQGDLRPLTESEILAMSPAEFDAEP
jgi:hypothetical protein